jgi:hydrogenase expression/formation protein HypE
MEIGKLPNDTLEKIVLSNIKKRREEVIVRAGIGEDCAVLDFGEYSCVVSTDPITGATKNIGSLAIHISCNDVASNGADPIGVLMTILAPPDTTEHDIELIMKEAGEAAEKINVEIIGGHTEITDAVNRVVISTAVIGRQLKENTLASKDIKIGDKVLITKSAAIEGTSIIANELSDMLEGKIDHLLLKSAKELGSDISVIMEGRICSKIGVSYMHDITEGGVLGAAWEASRAIGKGILIDVSKVPIEESTSKICEFLDINPLRLISSGSMMIIAPYEKIDTIQKELLHNNISSSVIGEITEEGILMKENGQVIPINPPGSDELYKVI